MLLFFTYKLTVWGKSDQNLTYFIIVSSVSDPKSAGCSLLRAKGFSCCMNVLYVVLGISF
jgi:hypothetical protein